MRIRITAAALTAAAALTLTACGSDGDSEGSVDACKAAMAEDFDAAADAEETGEEIDEAARPAACAGVDQAALEKIVGELVEEQITDEMGELEESMEAEFDTP